MSRWKKLLIFFTSLFILTGVGGAFLYNYLVQNLPQIMKVEDYHPLLVSQVYDRQNKKIGEFFRERRILVPYAQMPPLLIKAFIAAEDDQFFSHRGINYLAILRASIANLKAGKKVQGGSTITQQVARTFFLSSEKTLFRKIKEALLAKKLEDYLSKEEILYLYLNQIFFGQGAYGIGAAAEVYFRKPVQSLTLPEIAILAGLPKAPSDYSPSRYPQKSKQRQIYVLRRMVEVGFISQKEADRAIAENLKVYLRENYMAYAPFFLEAVRQLLITQLGEETVLDKGLRIYTSLDLQKQIKAQEAIELGLKNLDKRQGYRGAEKNIQDLKEKQEFLLRTRDNLIADVIPERVILPEGSFVSYGVLNTNYSLKQGLPFYLKMGTKTQGIVTKIDDILGLVYVEVAEVKGIIDIDTMRWARFKESKKDSHSERLEKPSQALKVGDVISVELTQPHFFADRLKRFEFENFSGFHLDQDPLVQGALLSIDQESNDVISMIGGYDYEKSKFNRSLQAARQTGSSFKSIIYTAALDKGYTAATPIMDAPLVFEETKQNSNSGGGTSGKKNATAKIMDDDESEGQDSTKVWKPTNHSKSFSGDIIFRNALVQSLNVPTVKIIEDISVPWVVDYARRLGVFSPLNLDFTLALGSSSLTLYEMTKLFSQFGKLGRRVRPVIVHRVEDFYGGKLMDQITLDFRFGKETYASETQFEERRKVYLEKQKELNKDVNGVQGLADRADRVDKSDNGDKKDRGDKSDKADKPDKGEKATKVEKADKNEKNIIDSHIFFEDPEQLISPQTAYLITSLLKAVVDDPNGTGGRAKTLGREVAGKTGTTNGYYDAWFLGFTPQICTGVWVGFDHEETLGKGEVGGRAALPIWVEYMKAAHQDLPILSFPIPDGIVFANIDSETGKLATSQTKRVIRQAFLEGTEPGLFQNHKQEDTDFYKEDFSD